VDGVVVYVGILAVERWRNRPIVVPGWDSKVTEVTPSETINLWTLMFRLYGPKGAAAQGEVSCEVDVGGKSYHSKERFPTFDSVHLQPGELPHYVAFFPEAFEGAKREDGDYELRWYEAHGLSRRLLARPHRFKLRNGRVHRAKRE
jgi:hypothetical protein